MFELINRWEEIPQVVVSSTIYPLKHYSDRQSPCIMFNTRNINVTEIVVENLQIKRRKRVVLV